VAGQGALPAQDSDAVRERPRGRGQGIGGLVLEKTATITRVSPDPRGARLGRVTGCHEGWPTPLRATRLTPSLARAAHRTSTIQPGDAAGSGMAGCTAPLGAHQAAASNYPKIRADTTCR